MPENNIDDIWVHNCETTAEMIKLLDRLSSKFIYIYAPDIHLIVESIQPPKTLITALLQTFQYVNMCLLSYVKVTDNCIIVDTNNCVQII